MSRSRGSRVAVALAVFALALVALAQAVLPGVAASRVRARVAAYGRIRSVHVSAFPAVELLWGKADSVSVSAETLTVSAQEIASLLSQARELGDLHVASDTAVLRGPLLASGLEVGHVRLSKRGTLLGASATLTQTQLTAALPSGVSVEPIASGSGAVEARASGGLFGIRASLDVLVRPVQGQLIAEPRGIPFGSIASLTLFSDPRVKVLAVGMRVLSSNPLSYEVSLSGRLS